MLHIKICIVNKTHDYKETYGLFYTLDSQLKYYLCVKIKQPQTINTSLNSVTVLGICRMISANHIVLLTSVASRQSSTILTANYKQAYLLCELLIEFSNVIYPFLIFHLLY